MKKMTRKTKHAADRFLAVLLAVLLVVGMLPTGIFAGEADVSGDTADAAAGREAEAVEVENDRLDEILSQDSDEEESLSLYADDEYVTVIVEMEAEPVLAFYADSEYAALDGETTAGEAVSDFLASDEAAVITEEVEQSQEAVISEIGEIAADVEQTLAEEADAREADLTANVQTASVNSAQSMSDTEADDAAEEGFEVVYRWSTIANAMAVRIPYGALSSISKIDGVKRAYVEHTYSLPEDVETDATYDDPNYSYSLNLAGVTEAWAEGYTGLGMVVAVLDTGIDITWGITDSTGANYGVTQVHEAFTDESFATSGSKLYENLRWTSSSMKYFVENTQLNSNTNGDGEMVIWDNNALYKNLKVPYACDYADGDLNVYNANSSHGCHVSGTVAGYAATDEGEVIFSGVAPDAQILMMKVFGDEDSGAYESVIIMALEDSIKLGADVINLSLGSDNGFAEDDTLQNDMFDRVEEAGIVIVTSAGNSSDSDAYNNYGDETLAENPETSMMSSPAIYDSNLAVASIENAITVESYFTWEDVEGVTHEVSFTDYWSVAMKQKFSDGEYPIYYVSGTGTYNDYYNAGFRSYYGYGTKGVNGIALVERGDLSFEDKINNATSFYESYYNSSIGSYVSGCPVQAVIVYDNDPESEELITMSVSNTTLTSAFISGKDGAEIVAALQSGYQVYLTVSSVDKTVGSETAGEMSEFSSWGAGPSLELKPEITAPGGNIWSTVPDTTTSGDGEYTGSYEMMSGTSMAAPHMTGIATLVRQYVQSSSDFKGLLRTDADDVVKQLLVSTAVPQTDANGVYYSPRLQGAGLVNAGAAVTTPAYISVEGQSVGKLELSDDAERTGKYDIEFTLHNISESEVSYDVSVVLMRPATETTESYYGTDATFMTDDDVIIKTVRLGNVTVAANGSTDVSETVALTAEEKAELNALFENGTYIEGFVILTDPNDENPQIGLPMLAFYGDWTAAPIFDTSVWFVDPDSDYDEEYGAFAEETTWGTSIVGSTIGTIGYLNLGENAFDTSTAEDGSDIVQYVYFEENFGISPNGDGYMDAVDDYILYQLRDAKLVVVEVTDAETGEVYMLDGTSYMSKTVYSTSYGMALPYSAYGVLPTWDGTDLEGNVLPTGTKCIYTITAYGDGDYPTVWSEEDGMYVTDFESILDGSAVPTFNGHAMDMTGDVISFEIVVDTEAPKLENNAVSVYEVEEEDGTHVYMTGTVYDVDGSIANIEVYPYVMRSYVEGYGDPTYGEYGIDYLNTFYTENVYDAGTETLTFTADVTEYVRENWSYSSEKYYYQFTWTGNVFISCGDYAANDRTYAVTVDATEGIVLSQTSALLHITLDENDNITEGASFELSVLDNTGAEVKGDITRTSSNPEVATVDEFGHVEATGVGQTIITVAKGDAYAICVVAVEATTTEVIDFDLSIENFDTLTPDGQLTVYVTNLQPADVTIESVTWLVYESDEYAEDYGAGLVTVSQNRSDGLSGIIYLNYNNCASLGVDEMPAGDGWLDVTINGVTRTMTFSWEDLYKTSSDDDLVSALNYADQSIYVTLGETATLEAKYNNTSMHSVGEVALYTAEGAYAYNYNYDNPTTAATGLVLDGQPYFNSGASWSGRIVNEEGYDLPSSITVWTRGSDGYESLVSNYSWSTNYTYDSETGEIWVKNTPYTNTSILVIRADGVENPDAVAGELSGTEWTMPDGLYGPFDWTITSGTGTGEEVTVTQTYGSDINAYAYTPSEPGVSIVTATTKDGAYTLNFAVVCEPVAVESLDLESHSITMTQYDIFDTTQEGFVSISPEPTLAKDAEVSWTSYDESIVQVGENGELIAVGAGDVYVKGYLTTDNTVTTYLIIHVDAKIWTVQFVDWDGTVLEEQSVADGNSAVPPEDPAREGYTFTGWDVAFDEIESDLTVTAQYEEIVLVDKTELKVAYEDAAENLNKTLNENDYTVESWAAFKKAVEAAEVVLADENATQDEVDAALAALNAAIAGLAKASEGDGNNDGTGDDTPADTVDKAALEAAYGKAAEDLNKNLTESDYTAESWAAYKQAVEAAEAVLADEKATQAEVDAALAALNEAAAGLTKTSENGSGTGNTGNGSNTNSTGSDKTDPVASPTDAGTNGQAPTTADLSPAAYAAYALLAAAALAMAVLLMKKKVND